MRLGDLPNTAILLVFVAVVFVAGFLVLDGLDSDLTANSYADHLRKPLYERN